VGCNERASARSFQHLLDSFHTETAVGGRGCDVVRWGGGHLKSERTSRSGLENAENGFHFISIGGRKSPGVARPLEMLSKSGPPSAGRKWPDREPVARQNLRFVLSARPSHGGHAVALCRASQFSCRGPDKVESEAACRLCRGAALFCSDPRQSQLSGTTAIAELEWELELE
jgi:hypothetical protein